MCASAPLMGAFINLNRSSVASFDIQPPKDYIRPQGLASCMGAIQGEAQYLTHNVQPRSHIHGSSINSCALHLGNFMATVLLTAFMFLPHHLCQHP